MRLSRRRFLAKTGLTAACYALNGCGRRHLPPQNKGEKTGDRSQSTLHEAWFYESLADRKVRCRLCPRQCVVTDGNRGYCRVRENRAGKLYSLVYGRPCTINIDPIEKKPFFHVYPGSKALSLATAGCNLACKFCQNWEISQASPENVKTLDLSPLEIARRIAMEEGCNFAYTGNMPGAEGENTYCPKCKAVVVQRYGMKMLSNELKNGKCRKCGTAIPGVWG